MQLIYGGSIEEDKSINIFHVIKNKEIIVYFQPIVSFAKKEVVGFEGLVRGISPITKEIISPIDLFAAARDRGLTRELDILCREKVIEAFKDIYQKDKNVLLFLNVDATIIGQQESSRHIINIVEKFNIAPQNIVIEVNEYKVHDTSMLKDFIGKCREQGFSIALDDVGTGFSNLDRISIVKPDIIKIDMSLIRNINFDYYKQEVFKALVNLCNKVGALVVAEGVETEDEALQVLELGGNMIQGYFFSKPNNIEDSLLTSIKCRIQEVTKNFKSYMNSKAKDEKSAYKLIDTIINSIIEDLAMCFDNDFDEVLTKGLKENRVIECGYILDENGIQISDTICFCGLTACKKNLIFNPAEKGTDHSMKKYYYRLINARLNKYITEPYISLATGNQCITFTKTFRDLEGKKFILCVDFTPGFEKL